MADYEKIMVALRNAHAAGDTAAATRLAQMAKGAKNSEAMAGRIAAAKAGTLEMQPGSEASAAEANAAAMAQMQQPNDAFGQGFQEGLGTVPGLLAGASRGASQLVGLPGTIGDLLNTGAVNATNALFGTDLQTTREAMGAPSPFSGEGIQSAVSGATGGASEYRAPGLTGEYASTIGEFVGGGPSSSARNLAIAALSGATSEAAGQATKGSALEPVARIAGAFFAPVAIATGNKTVNALMTRASEAPSLDTLKQAKSAAYKAVDDAGVQFGPDETGKLFSNVQAALGKTDFVPEVDAQTRAALQIIERNAGKSLTLGQLDSIRQGLWKRYNAAPNEVAILDMIDEVDTLIDGMPAATPLMGAARVANSRFKKAELIENAFQKAEDQTAATGSGGNIVNKYRQAVTSIINNPKQARFFTKDEIAMMRNFVSGSNAENALRLVGKISPSGNGLMMALNLGAVAYNPAMLLATVAGAGSKAISERMAVSGAGRLRDALATGVIPQRTPGTFVPDAVRNIPGLLAD